ncbi:hypothetical protein [Gilvimarinus algae]|uniref:Uncharacterized protein n=1 Tax=Gilvimarinus algae TaxID=3058037 RepID=A0ABT8TGG0_9GAMM|nr:hypothetical protein [Gilvimarinus sp. SDUM040014]MDO3382720.1 hypothetical protein [Gilvimarinus sp. SDUM040014]
MTKTSFSPQQQAWMNQFNEIMADPQKREEFLRDPLAAMQRMGADLNSPHIRAFASGLESMVMTEELKQRPGALSKTQQPMLLKAKSNAFEEHFHVSIEFWGVVMRVDHEAIKQLPKGSDAIKKLAETATEVMRVAGEGGPLAPFIAIGLLYWYAVFTAYTVVMPAIDQGKGVYLTISWPQIGLAIASGGLIAAAAFPVPTAVV